MKIKRRDEVPLTDAPGFAGVAKQVVLGPADGSDEIVLRYFTLDPHGATPRHNHDFPHVMKVERGSGVAVGPDGVERPVGLGDYVYVPPDEVHNFKNVGDGPFEIICIVPRRGEAPSPT